MCAGGVILTLSWSWFFRLDLNPWKPRNPRNFKGHSSTPFVCNSWSDVIRCAEFTCPTIQLAQPANTKYWGHDRVMILILEFLNPSNPRNPGNPWNPWNCEFSRVARSYEDIDEWGHVEEASLWPCHDGAPPSYPPPCLSFAYKTIVWLLYYTMQCLSFTSKIILYHTMPIFCIQNPTIQCNACLSHTRPLYGYHIMPYHEMPIFRK